MTEEPPPSERAGDRHDRASWPMIAMRYVLPVVVAIAGLIVMTLGGESNVEGGAGIVGAGIAIYAMNWLYRASVEGDRVREEEEAARVYLDLHGRWPDEAPAPGSGQARAAAGARQASPSGQAHRTIGAASPLAHPRPPSLRREAPHRRGS